ncbi:amino acid adenylation domain-containing protein [Pectobacteriaceae bacterium CE90]|nr:amino acid adenylation domain-containing protein [Pectobacteriaceae bacterium CE90]
MDSINYLISQKVTSISLARPENTAVIYGSNKLTYRQLEIHTTRIAHYLASHYPKNKNGKIAIYLEPGLYLPVILLSIMKAGFTYIPLSHFHPLERINTIIDDSLSFLIITTKDIYQRDKLVKLGKTTLFLEDLIVLPEGAITGNLPQVTADDLAYILYTSGSTGIPKGVAIEHGNMRYYLNWFNEDLWPLTRACLPLTSSLSFAAAVTQLYAPLLRGDTLYILPKDILHHYPDLLNWYQQHPDGALYCVPTIWEELLNYTRQRRDIESLRLPKTVFLSGEAVSNNLKNRTFREVPDIRLFNLYGPTETTANGSFTELSPQRPVTIGKALRGSELLIVDEQCQPVIPGKVGEVCILGDGVAQGYINRDALTRERFFTVERQGRSYRAHRTGDLGKVLDDGEVLYLGRCDRQVKINGIRIEPEEIEQILQCHAGIAKAVVRCDDSLTTPRLIAYLIAAGERLTLKALRQYLAERLPVAMIPGSFIYLDAIPKLPNGKLDVKRLPPPSPLRPALQTPYATAANKLEQELIDIWQEVLGIVDPGANDNFFELGGNSLQVMQVRRRIRQQLYADIDHDCFFANPTPRALAGVVPYYCNDESNSDDDNNAEPRLSSQQRYFLTLELLSENPWAYQIYFAIDIRGDLNENAINHSLSRILEQNAILRTRFDLDSGDGFGGIAPAVKVTVARRKVTLPDAHPLRDSVLLELARAEPAEFEQLPIVDFQLLEQAPQHHVLLGRVHHTLFDHDAIAPFFHQFVSYYRAFLAGDTAYRINSPWQYADYCRQQTCEDTPARHQQELAFWRQTLAGYRRQGALPPQALRPTVAEGRNYLITLSTDLSHQLRHFSRQRQVTPFITLLTLFNLLLQQHTDYQRRPIGIPISDRTSQDNADIMGCFVNMTSFFMPIDSGDTLKSLLERCKKQLFPLLEHQHLSYQDVVNALRNTADETLLHFSVGFNYLTALPEKENSNSCEFSVSEIYHQQARLDMTLLIQDADCFTLCFNYNPGIYPEENIKNLARKYCELLSELSA